jgi:branched-chain amino acid transport system ATP-binding protein
MPALVVEDLHVRYGSIAAVRGLSLTCDSGELVALLGPNGAGKSSSLLGIGGALAGAASGQVSLDGRPLHGRSPEDVSRAGIVLVPERRRIFGSLTVRENLLVGASGWASRRAAEAQAVTVLERFGALGAARDRAGGLLSGGQQQQLAIARALMTRPKVLLLDEPSLGLSPDLVEVVFELVAELRDEGIGVLLVEQQAAQAMKVADRTFLMRKGVLEGRVGERDSERVASSYLGGPAVEGVR